MYGQPLFLKASDYYVWWRLRNLWEVLGLLGWSNQCSIVCVNSALPINNNWDDWLQRSIIWFLQMHSETIQSIGTTSPTTHNEPMNCLYVLHPNLCGRIMIITFSQLFIQNALSRRLLKDTQICNGIDWCMWRIVLEQRKLCAEGFWDTTNVTQEFMKVYDTDAFYQHWMHSSTAVEKSTMTVRKERSCTE